MRDKGDDAAADDKGERDQCPNEKPRVRAAGTIIGQCNPSNLWRTVFPFVLARSLPSGYQGRCREGHAVQ